MDENYMLDAAALLCALRRRIKVGKMARFLEIPILGFLELQNGKLEPWLPVPHLPTQDYDFMTKPSHHRRLLMKKNDLDLNHHKISFHWIPITRIPINNFQNKA